jgi:hypothetical protein
MVTGERISTCIFFAIEELSDELTLARLHHQRKARGESVTGLLSLDHFDGFFFWLGGWWLSGVRRINIERKKSFVWKWGSPST